MQSETFVTPAGWLQVKKHQFAKLTFSPRTLALLEAISAATCNFAISIVAARSFDSDHFAGYVTALSATFVAIAFLRVLFVTPATIRADLWYSRQLPTLAAIHFISIVLLATIVTLLLSAVAAALGSPLWKAAAMAAPGVSLWFIGVEFERAMLIKTKRVRLLPLIIALQVTALAVLLPATLAHLITFPVFIGGLALIGCARSLIAFSGYLRPQWAKGISRMKTGLHNSGLSGMAYLTGSVACSHAPVFALSLLSLPMAAGAFGAMRSLYQPMQIIFRSRDVVNLTRFHNDRSSAAQPLVHQFRRSLLRTLWLSLALAALLALAGPWLVHFAYGGRFDDHVTTYWLWGIIMVLINLVAIADAFISHSNQQNRYAIVQILAGASTIALSFLLAPAFADAGAAVAAIVGWTIIIIGALIVIHRASRARSKVS